jgi:hypothetical protein
MSGQRFGIEIKQYSEADRQRWDEFVEHSQQGTLFHTRAFLAYHPRGRFADDSLLFFDKGSLLAVLPAATRIRNEARVLCSHPGASFGGFVTRPHLSLADTDHIISAFLIYCHEQGYAGAELTLPPQIYFSHPDNHIEYILYRRGFQYLKREMTSAIALGAPLDYWPREARRAKRRAEKRSVRIEENEEWESFYTLLEQHMWQRHQVRPTHTLEELQRLRELCPQRLRLFAALVDQEIVAGMLLFLCNRSVALAFYYLSHRDGFQHYHAFYSLVAEVLQWCERQGFRYLDFGTYTIDSQPNWGLAGFKEGFGSQGIFRDTMSMAFGPR